MRIQKKKKNWRKLLKTVKKIEVELGPKEWVDLENVKMQVSLEVSASKGSPN